LLPERSRLPPFPSSCCCSSSYPLLLTNRSTFSSALVVLPATARFLFFSRGEMERRNGAEQSPRQFVRPSKGSPLLAENTRTYSNTIIRNKNCSQGDPSGDP